MKYNQPHKSDPIQSRPQSKEYREGWDNIFGKKAKSNKLTLSKENSMATRMLSALRFNKK